MDRHTPQDPQEPQESLEPQGSRRRLEPLEPREQEAELVVAAAAVLRGGRLLVVSKKAAPGFFYLPGGKLEPGESARAAMTRELREELGVTPLDVAPLTDVRATAALEGVPLRMAVFSATLDGEPAPAAEIAALRWTDGTEEPGFTLAPAVRDHVLPLVVPAASGR